MSRSSLLPNLVLVVLALSGVGLVVYGLSDRAARSPVPVPADAAPGGGEQPLPMVSSGSGTFTNRAPGKTEEPLGEALCAGCDVVVITLCSLRQDRVSAYGQHEGLTPALDAIAAEGALFEQAYAASNFTLAGLTAVLTGRFASTTGVTGWDKGLTTDVPTLPEILSYYGYRTAAFTTDAPSGFRPDYGLDRGFQHMEIVASPRGTPDGHRRGGTPGEPGESAAPVVQWLDDQPDDAPLMVMFHSRTAHFPFVIGDEGAEDDPTGITQGLWDAGQNDETQQSMPGMAGGTAQKGVVQIVGTDPLQELVNQHGDAAVNMWKEHYASAVRLMDHDIARVMEALENRGRLDRTVIVVVADHGESLNDHSELLHGDAYYDSVIRVPLVIRVPGVEPSRIPALVSHVDLLPTILELVGAVEPAGIDGISLVGLLTNALQSVRSTALSEGGVARQVGELTGAVISPPWVLMKQQRGCGSLGPSPEGSVPICLFDMSSDPEQEHDVAALHPEVVEDLERRWTGFREARAGTPLDLQLSEEFVRELRENGYDFRAAAPE